MPPLPDDTRHDDFDRPRKKRKGGSGTAIALICLGLLLVGGLIFALIYFLGGNNLDSEMLAYLPAETNVIVGVDVEELMKNEKVKNSVMGMLQGDGHDFYAKLKEAG